MTVSNEVHPVVDFEPNSTRVRRFDFGRWLGKGFDDIVIASIATVRTMLASRALRISSVVSYCTAGMVYFFEYLETAERRPIAGEITGRLVRGYIKWLATERRLRYTAQRNVYTATKCVLVEMVRLQCITADPSTFPANPYPRASAQVQGATPFTMGERQRLADALKRELIAIHKGAFEGSESEKLVVYALAICLRTGLNTIPLIELSRDCVRSHPLRSNMRMLVHTKWRSHAVLHAQMEVKTTQTSISSDAVALLDIVMKRTTSIADEAPDRLQERLWLYRSESRISRGEVRVLVSSDLYRGASRLASRHALRGDDGNRLRVNPSRFRKTLENRLWRLSGGDPLAVAQIMNHSVRVSDRHYLSVTPEMEENHRRLGEELVSRWRGTSIRPSMTDAALPSSAGRTPLGHCKDPIGGERAPGNGKPCFDFLSCFSCSSYVVIEQEEDLYRLLSFRGFLVREQDRVGSTKWVEHYAWIVRLIDALAADRFDEKTVSAVSERAMVRPHPFWADPSTQGVRID